VAEVIRKRNTEARRFSARQLDGWTAAMDAQPVAGPQELAVLVRALLTGLAMQRRIEPETVSDELALRGLCALLGFDFSDPTQPSEPPETRMSGATP
jgi:hypothetical protein